MRRFRQRRDPGLSMGFFGLWLICPGVGAYAAGVADIIDLGALGARGFRFESGVQVNQELVGPIGDFNGDGMPDLLVLGYGQISSGYTGSFVSIAFGRSSWESVTPISGPLESVAVLKSSAVERQGIIGCAASVGDLSGDGLPDLLISFPEYQSAGKSSRVDLVFGTPALEGGLELDVQEDSLSALSFYSSIDRTRLGDRVHFDQTLSGIGDFNGDGRSDFVIAAPFADFDGEAVVGRVFVVFWKPELVSLGEIDVERLGSDIPGFIAVGESKEVPGRLGEAAGWEVAGPGDVNGDGLADLLIGAPFYDDGADHSPRVYLVFGSSSFPGRIDLGDLGSRGVRIWGDFPSIEESAPPALGEEISAAGDVNGDGFADFLLGAQGDCCRFMHETFPGRTYLVFGRAQWPERLGIEAEVGVSVVSLGDSQPGDHSGYGVSSAGDQDGDGLLDLLIGSSYADRKGYSRVGEAYVVYGGDLHGRYSLGDVPATLPGILLKGVFDLDGTGSQVAGLGDVNGDGRPDFAVGALRPFGTEARRSQYPERTFVIFGAGGTLPLGLNRLEPAFGPIDGGYEVAVMGSGFAAGVEVFFGGEKASVSDVASTSELRVTVPRGLQTGRADVEIRRGGELQRLAGAFEYTRRFPDLDLSAPGRGVSVLTGEGMGLPFAYALAAGDVNGDGLADVAIGSNLLDSNQGSVTVIYGSTSPLPPRTRLLDIPNKGRGFILKSDRFGVSGKLNVHLGDDVNGDGIGDILIGTAPYDAFIVFGARQFKAELNLDELISTGAGVRILQSEAGLPLDGQGFRVAGVADLDGDGLAELAVGIPDLDSGGAVYVVAGRTDWPQELDLSGEVRVLKLSSLFSSRVGRDLAGVGDFNGDELPDLLVGTTGPVFPAQGSGWALLIYGNHDLEGELTFEELLEAGRGVEFELRSGFDAYHDSTVSRAGDVNGDGLQDLLITVLGGGSLREGHTYLIYGSTELAGRVTLPDQIGDFGTLLEGTLRDDLASDAASLGDFDGDGLSDVIVGVPGPHNVLMGGTPGKAFLVLGSPSLPPKLSLGGIGDRGLRIDGVVPSGLAGLRVAGGDINGDGLGDMLIGEAGYVDAPGNVYVCLSPYAGSTFIRGDSNFDGTVNISDAVFTLTSLFLGGASPRCEDAADADDSGALDITDAIRVLNHLFLGTASLPEPYPAEGQDPTADPLTCRGF